MILMSNCDIESMYNQLNQVSYHTIYFCVQSPSKLIRAQEQIMYEPHTFMSHGCRAHILFVTQSNCWFCRKIRSERTESFLAFLSKEHVFTKQCRSDKCYTITYHTFFNVNVADQTLKEVKLNEICMKESILLVIGICWHV